MCTVLHKVPCNWFKLRTSFNLIDYECCHLIGSSLNGVSIVVASFRIALALTWGKLHEIWL